MSNREKVLLTNLERRGGEGITIHWKWVMVVVVFGLTGTVASLKMSHFERD